MEAHLSLRTGLLLILRSRRILAFLASSSRLLFQSPVLLLSGSATVCEADRAFSRAMLGRPVTFDCFCFSHARLVPALLFGDGITRSVTLDCWLRLMLPLFVGSV